MAHTDHDPGADLDALTQQIDDLLQEVERATAELDERDRDAPSNRRQPPDSQTTAPEPADQPQAPSSLEGSNPEHPAPGDTDPSESSLPSAGREDDTPTVAVDEDRDSALESLAEDLDLGVEQMMASATDSDAVSNPEPEPTDSPDLVERESDETISDAAPRSGHPAVAVADDDDERNTEAAPDTDPPDAHGNLDSELAGLVDDLIEGDLTDGDGTPAKPTIPRSAETIAPHQPEQDTPPSEAPDGASSSPIESHDEPAAEHVSSRTSSSDPSPPASEPSPEAPSASTRAGAGRGRIAHKMERACAGAQVVARQARTRAGPFMTKVRVAAASLAERAEPHARRGAELAARPLRNRPAIVRQTVGWFALWTLFMAVCVWGVLMFF